MIGLLFRRWCRKELGTVEMLLRAILKIVEKQMTELKTVQDKLADVAGKIDTVMADVTGALKTEIEVIKSAMATLKAEVGENPTLKAGLDAMSGQLDAMSNRLDSLDQAVKAETADLKAVADGAVASGGPAA